MSGRDTSSTELLSAYLDGELSTEERHEVERKLAASNELRQLLGQLRQLSDDLRRLPRYHLGEPVYNRIVREIEQISQETVTDEEEHQFSDEMIGAYLDGELPDTDRHRVERQLETSAEYRQLLGELRDLQDTLQSLPTYQMDDGFADRVVRRAERETLLGSATDAAQVTTAPKPLSVAKRSRWRFYAWAAVTVAAVIALVFSIPRGDDDSGLDLVGPGTNTETPDVDTDSVPRVPPREDPALVGVDSDAKRDSHEVGPLGPIDANSDAQWQLVSDIQENCRARIILVYELTVTPEGVERAAFVNLLRRHGILLRQATPVGPKEQESLLKHRFFRGVKITSGKTDDMDEIELYLVHCVARDAEAIWRDLIGRPEGFGSFYLDVTTAEAGDKVLHHLCEASGVSDQTGQAAQLMVSFAMLSRTARNLGVFGKISWIEPSLLDGSLARPPEPKRNDMPEESDRDTVGIGPTPEAAATGDFSCEVLFVVRNLKPLDGDEAEDESDAETQQHGD